MRDDSIPVRSKRLLRTLDTAQYLSISSWKLCRLIQAGRLPVVQDGDGAPFLLDVRDLDGYIERNKRNATIRLFPLTSYVLARKIEG